ncbi:hypothetical protein SAMN05421756_11021 [Microlunatus flavus]|uniref:Uncharacterized protein n=1 Tax=Microlunatus flavus TaxID=1036181 RepID=A0A1H9MAN8_9ACTN|nr:hypothetical protein SAMN05421756_11021 [Microlunatus flavus]
MLRERLRSVGGALLGLGLAVYLYSCYHVLEAGG